MIYSLIGVFFVALMIYAGLNQIRIMRLNSQVDGLKNQAEDPSIVDKFILIKEKEEEMIIFKTEVEKIQYMDKVIESKEIVSEEFIRNITYNLPKDTYLTSITIYEDSINLLGVSNDKWSIAEFVRALDTMDGLDNVYISSISTKEDKFTFNLDIRLAQEDINAEDETEEVQDQISN